MPEQDIYPSQQEEADDLEKNAFLRDSTTAWQSDEEEEKEFLEPLKKTEYYPDGRPKEISRQKMFGRSYSEEINAVVDGPKFQPASVDNKPMLAVFMLEVLSVVALAVAGAVSGAYQDFDAKFEVTLGGQTFHPHELALSGEWVGVLVGGLLVSALLPFLSLALLYVFPYSIAWISCLLAPATLFYCGWLALKISDRAYIHTGLGPFWWRNWLVGICFVVGAVWLLSALAMYDKINFTATLMRCSTRLAESKPSIITLGIGHSLLSCLFLVFHGLAAIVIADSFVDKHFGLLVSLWIMLIPALWSVGVAYYAYFISAAGLMARWYFGEAVSVGASLWMAWVYCLGSIALGAAVLPLMKTVQTCLGFCVTSPKDGQPNACYLFCWRAMDTVEWMVASFNRFSFALIAVFGMSFYKSGYETIRIIEDKGLDVVLPSYILGFVSFGFCSATELFSLICVLSISGWSVFGAVAHGALGAGRHVPPDYELGGALSPEAAKNELRAMQVVVFSVVFGICVMSQFASAIDGMSTALLTCFVEDRDQFAKIDKEAYDWLLKTFEKVGEGAPLLGNRRPTQVAHFRKTDLKASSKGNDDLAPPVRKSIIGMV